MVRYADDLHNSDNKYVYSRNYVLLLRFGRFGTRIPEVFVVEAIHNSNTIDSIHLRNGLVCGGLQQANRSAHRLYGLQFR